MLDCVEGFHNLLILGIFVHKIPTLGPLLALTNDLLWILTDSLANIPSPTHHLTQNQEALIPLITTYSKVQLNKLSHLILYL